MSQRRVIVALVAWAIAGCAGEEKTPLPYYGDLAPLDGAAGAGGSGGGQGAAGSAGSMVGVGPIVLNEIDPSGDPADWIELKNQSGAAVDISGWVIGQGYDGATPLADADKLVVPPGTSLAAGAHWVAFTRAANGPGPGDFGVGKTAKERFSLFDPAGTLVDDTTTDGSTNAPIATGTSWARLPDGTGAFQRATSTKGADNAP